MEFGVGQVGCLPLRLKSTFFESLFGTVLIEFFFLNVDFNIRGKQCINTKSHVIPNFRSQDIMKKKIKD